MEVTDSDKQPSLLNTELITFAKSFITDSLVFVEGRSISEAGGETVKSFVPIFNSSIQLNFLKMNFFFDICNNFLSLRTNHYKCKYSIQL